MAKILANRYLLTHPAEREQHYHPTWVTEDTIKKKRWRLSSPVVIQMQIPLGIRSSSCLSQTWAWSRGPPGTASCIEALPPTKTSSVRPLSPLSPKRSHYPESCWEGESRQRTRERPGLMESPASCGLRLSAQILMDCDMNTVLTKC